MNADPLGELVARSLGAAAPDVTDLRTEPVPGRPDQERVRFRLRGEEASLVLRRLDRERPLEAQLLPFLARKTDRVPVVRSRGVPPPAARARPWILVEDLTRDPPCDDPVAIVRAKVAVERAVARDAPALRALGVLVGGPAADELAAWPAVLVHGSLTRDRARLTARGVVLTDWDGAHLGAGLLDVARLAADAGTDLAALAEEYARAYERGVTAGEIAVLRALGW
ncbi:MAG TPA: hypothetical protein VFM93_10885 [Candidatus Limnocylindria bacterium]|nr:hypothetical protein [Candidatus Limnocylindria bacterium]